MEQVPQIRPNFVYPRLLSGEMGEIGRVAKQFSWDEDRFISRFLQATTQRQGHAQLIDLTNQIWSVLQNTDSTRIQADDWTEVQRIAETHGRDWQNIKIRIERGLRLDAPILVKLTAGYYLVSGNTRLMCAKALGVRPKVLIVDLTY